MAKIAFLGAGSTVFARNVLGDCMASEALSGAEIALYDINGERLAQSEKILSGIGRALGSKSKITCHVGPESLDDALRGADFVVNAVQVGGYEPCTVTDFEIPKKYGLRQTIADTFGIGGIMRALRTIPVMETFARAIEKTCPQAWLLNYANPMGALTGYMLLHTGVKTVGLCHSVQICSSGILRALGMEDKLAGRKELIAGINHMGWLLEIRDSGGADLYPEIRRRAREKNASSKHDDMVRFDYIDKLGYYCTESSEHNAEYNPFYIKARYPELIERFNIPLDEYPRRCVEQARAWKADYERLAAQETLAHKRSGEYASRMMEAISTGGAPYALNGNVLNRGGLIENFPASACVEVPCLVDGSGVRGCHVGSLPPQLAAMNMAHIGVQAVVIEAARTRKLEHVYHAAMLDPHTAAELSLDDIRAMTDELIAAHGSWLPKYS
ncbi:MAG: alpha-glucosidase/alpha-galactosidase [Treponema sp.]|nr:alpha-glucosidase/alpha-galactosidase [Treponema sp.]